MIGQSMFCRAYYALFNNSTKMVLTNRINHVNFTPTCKGLKQDASYLEKYKLPEKPKKPLSSFFTFMIEKRPIVTKQNPSLSNKDVVRKLSEEWKLLSADAKGKYEEQAKQSKALYDKKFLEYTENLTPEQEDVIKEITKEKSENRQRRRYKQELRDEQKPKKPATSFGIFMQINSEKRGQKSITEFMKQLKDQWAKTSDAEKDKFKLEYAKNKQQYEKELAVWEAKMIARGKEHLVRANTLKGEYLKEKVVKKNKKSE